MAISGMMMGSLSKGMQDILEKNFKAGKYTATNICIVSGDSEKKGEEHHVRFELRIFMSEKEFKKAINVL